MQLKENVSKKQIVAKGARAKQQIVTELEDRGLQQWKKFVCDEAEVLGTSIGNTALSKKEEKRIKKYSERVQLIDTLPLVMCKKVGFKQAIALSTLNYGWLFRQPNKKILQKAANQMSGQQLRGGSRQLKQVLEANVHPQVAIACGLANLTLASRNNPAIAEWYQWTNETQHSVRQLRLVMAELGFAVQGEFLWRHPDTLEEVNLEVIDTEVYKNFKQELEKRKKAVAHKIRETFRAQEWRILLDKDH